DVIQLAVKQHAWTVASLAAAEEALLLLPVLALALTTGMMARRLLVYWMRFTRRQPAFRVASALAAALAVFIGSSVLATPRLYQPITATHRGTVPPPSAIRQLADPLSHR